MSEQKGTSFASELQRLMEAHEPALGIRDLAEELGSTYEYVRRLVRGMNLPSKYYLEPIARILGCDQAYLAELVKGDKFRKEFGEGSPSPAFNPEVEPFAKTWNLLTAEQQAELLKMLKGFVQQNRKNAKSLYRPS